MIQLLTSPASVLIAYAWAITVTVAIMCRSIRKRKVSPVVSASEREQNAAKVLSKL